MEGFYHLLFYAAPLIPLPIALWVHGRKGIDLRWVLRFSVGRTGGSLPPSASRFLENQAAG